MTRDREFWTSWLIGVNASADHYDTFADEILAAIAEAVTRERESAGRHIKSIRRKYLLHVEIDGHEWKHVVYELQRQVDHIIQHGPKCNSVGGGGSTGHIVDIDIDETQTPERFEKQLEDYMEARRRSQTQGETSHG